MTTARVTQSILEVLVENGTPNLRVTQSILEVLTTTPFPPRRIFPIQQSRRITDNGVGTRVFPV